MRATTPSSVDGGVQRPGAGSPSPSLTSEKTLSGEELLEKQKKDEEDRKAFLELQGKFYEEQTKLKSLLGSVAGSAREKRKNELCLQEISVLPSDTNCYRTVGSSADATSPPWALLAALAQEALSCRCSRLQGRSHGTL